MKITKLFFALAIVSITFMSFTGTLKKWDFLGERIVDFGLDKDEIKVTIKEGTFTKIKLQVKRAPVHFRKVVVHYKNGNTEELELRDEIKAGGETRAIDLNGKERIITKVVFFYNSKVKANKKAVVRLYGMH